MLPEQLSCKYLYSSTLFYNLRAAIMSAARKLSLIFFVMRALYASAVHII